VSADLHAVPSFTLPSEVLDAISAVHDQRDQARSIACQLEQECDALLRLIVEVADEAEAFDSPVAVLLSRRLRAGVADIQAVTA
jgi:hypothetical protein